MYTLSDAERIVFYVKNLQATPNPTFQIIVEHIDYRDTIFYILYQVSMFFFFAMIVLTCLIVSRMFFRGCCSACANFFHGARAHRVANFIESQQIRDIQLQDRRRSVESHVSVARRREREQQV